MTEGAGPATLPTGMKERGKQTKLKLPQLLGLPSLLRGAGAADTRLSYASKLCRKMLN